MKRGIPHKRTRKVHAVPKRSPDVFDEGEKLIKKTKAWLDTRAQTDPQWAANYARQLLEIGTETLLTLIESKKLTDPRGFRDDAESSLCGYFQRLIYELCRLVKSGREDPVFVAWRGAAELTKAIHDLALTAGHSDEGMFSLQKIAVCEIYMPSLRAKVNKFDYDFKEVSAKIGLSLQTGINTGWSWTPKGFMSEIKKAKYDLNSLATQFVVAFIERVTQIQTITRESEAWLHGLQKRHPTSSKYKKMTLEDLLRQKYSADQVSELMACHPLPRFGINTIDQFWTKVLKPHLEKPDTLQKLQATPLYKELLDATDGKNYQMRALLKKRCKQALKPLVKPSGFP